MTVEEGNIIIANFLGGEVKQAWKVQESSVYAWYGKEVIQEYRKYHGLASVGNFENQCILVKDLKFFTDWNCLIPVVEKIESIWDDFHGYFGISIYSNSCSIQGTKLDLKNKHYAYFGDHTRDTKIQATWEAVVMFIMWYNENLKK